MTWPNATVSTTNLDAGSDEPRLARADLKDAVDKLNSIITDGPTRGFLEIGVDGAENYGGGVSLSRANLTINYATGPSFHSLDARSQHLILQPGTYMFDFPPIEPQGSGAWNFYSNTGNININGTTVNGLIKVLDMTGAPSSKSTILTSNSTSNCNISWSQFTSLNSPVECIRITKLG